jgi:hypothetical protein
MNIKNDPLQRPDSQRPPTTAERTAMEDKRNAVQELPEGSRAESKSRQDRIEISVQARRAEAESAGEPDRKEKVAKLRELYGNNNLNTPERARAAAEKMMKRLDQA